METSSFLYENLPYSILIWLHYGTSMLISYSYLIYVLPIVYNIVVMFLPHFNFGFMDKKGKGAGSGANLIPADLNKTLNDSKIFASTYSRNPKLFSAIPMQEVSTFFSKLDEKLETISSVIKDMPVAEESKKSEDSTDDKTASGSKAGKAGSGTDDFNKSDGSATDADNKKSKKSKKEGDELQKAKKSKNKGFLLYGNALFLLVIVALNAYSYFHYNSILSNFFVLHKGYFKFSEKEYRLDIKKVQQIKDKAKLEEVKDVNSLVEIINSVKSEKIRKEKMEQLKKEGKDKK